MGALGLIILGGIIGIVLFIGILNYGSEKEEIERKYMINIINESIHRLSMEPDCDPVVLRYFISN